MTPRPAAAHPPGTLPVSAEWRQRWRLTWRRSLGLKLVLLFVLLAGAMSVMSQSGLRS